MNALEKQLSRLPQYIRDGMPADELQIAIKTLNAMRSALNAGDEEGVRKWARKNITPEINDSLIKLARVLDQHETGEGNWQMLPLVQLMLNRLR